MYKTRIWSFLLARIENEYGVAGLMGNLQAESGLYPDRVQGDIPYSNFSKEYTAKVDSGEISEYDFIHHGPNGGGYGLAQWTSTDRKQALYNMYKSGEYSSIGDIDLALNYLWKELQGAYSGVLSILKSATSIKEASDKVLHDFERPAEAQSKELERLTLSTAIYEELVGTPPDLPDIPEELETFIKKRFNFILFNQQRKRVIHYGKGRFTRQTKRNRHMRR